MQPRIYVYKITFVGQPFWYWGFHKEKKFNEHYMGSPSTNKSYWEIYEPIKEIVELFEYSDEGYLKAQERENELIKPDINNPLCLNEHYGTVFSLKTRAEAARKAALANKERWGLLSREERCRITREHGMWSGTPLDRRREVAKKIQASKGTSVQILDLSTGIVTSFSSLKQARKHYRIGMTTVRKLFSGELPEYKGLKVIHAGIV